MTSPPVIVSGVTVMHYRRKPKRHEGDLYAARYEPGQSLDGLREVALMADRGAEMAEVPLPSGTVLVVRWTDYDVDRPAEPEFEVIRTGNYLAYSRTYGNLTENDDADLRQFYNQVEP